MSSIGRYANAAMTVDWTPQTLPAGTVSDVVTLATPDRSTTSGTLYRPAAAPQALVTLMHPRVDFTRHYLVPPLVAAGYAVWTQRARTVGNDLTTVHEQLLIDIATAHAHLRDRGFDRIFMLGNSGGASLYAFYVQQASRAPGDRLSDAPSGLPVDLTLRMPAPEGLVLLAPHPGQGEVLLHCIDPAVADEDDPGATTPELDLFDAANGFAAPPASSSFAPEFVARYRAAQRDRVARIDERMRALLAEQAEQRAAGRGGARDERRRSLAGRFVAVHRTDADPRTVDLSLDPSARDYGSIFGRRPDITNFGAVGFGRLTTPHAWLSTWSGLSTRAALARTAPHVGVPVLIVGYRADNSVFPADLDAIQNALGSVDAHRVDVDADHYGYRPGTQERLPEIAATIVQWLNRHNQ